MKRIKMNGSIGKGKYAIVDDVQYKKLGNYPLTTGKIGV